MYRRHTVSAGEGSRVEMGSTRSGSDSVRRVGTLSAGSGRFGCASAKNGVRSGYTREKCEEWDWSKSRRRAAGGIDASQREMREESVVKRVGRRVLNANRSVRREYVCKTATNFGLRSYIRVDHDRAGPHCPSDGAWCSVEMRNTRVWGGRDVHNLDELSV